MWALFLVTYTDGDYTLHVLTPEKYDAEAFDWATNHLRCQYKIQQKTTYSSWPSGRGSELLLFAGFARDVLKNAHTTSQEEDGFVAHVLDTLRKVRAAAVDANLDEIDELLAENDGLAKKVKGMFSSIVPAGAAHACRQHKIPEKAKESPASNKRKERSDEGREKIQRARKHLSRVQVNLCKNH